MLNRLPGNALDRKRFPIRRELPLTEGDDCDARTDDGRMIRAFPLGAIDDGDVLTELNELVLKRENLLEPLAEAGVPVTDALAACGALLERLAPPAKRRVLVSALPIAGVARIVGVKSDCVMIVALLASKFFRFGANVGRFLDANGRMTGVNVRFFVANVNRDFLRPFSSTSSSTSSTSPPSS